MGCPGRLAPGVRLRVQVAGMKDGAREDLWKRMGDSDSDTGPGEGRSEGHSCWSGLWL